jgi:hypothetical protein
MLHGLVGFQWKMSKHRNYWDEKEMSDTITSLLGAVFFGALVGAFIGAAYVVVKFFVWVIS